ncbi:LPS export ABC transporter permease LptF [Neoasaia chiangmaiensis]|uniref:LPS export ABC transporter permease LptF n=1 Tax=Neoasaia chiangmaiensis TaxID=320497 RepID=UPI00098A6AD7|nr:LPS export ABC transporter permease LptF [Neoasaia chiangmaiensis]
MPASAPATSSRATSSFKLPLLDRYVIRQLVIGLAAMTGGAVALIWLMQSLRFVSLVVDRGLSLRTFLGLTSLLIPGFVAVILPITTFLVVLFGYQRMAGDRELTVMRAAGLSSFQLARPGIICAVAATLLCYVLNLWLVPTAYHEFRRYEFQIRNRMAAFLLQDGVFTQLSQDMTVYVRTRERSGELHGILVEDDRQPDAHATILAEHGSMVVIDNQPRVVLYNGSRQEIDRKTGRLNVLSFARNTVDLTPNKKDSAELRDASEMSLHELLRPDPHEVAERDRGKFAVEAWRRLSSPLTVLSFSMIGMVAALGGVFSRHGSFKRPLIAIFGVVGLLALSLMLQNLAGRNLHLVPLIWIVAGLPALAGAAWLFGTEWRENRCAMLGGGPAVPTANGERHRGR